MIRRLALGLTAVSLAYLALLRLAVTLDYWERKHRVDRNPHLTTAMDGIIWRKARPVTWGSYRTPPRSAP